MWGSIASSTVGGHGADARSADGRPVVLDASRSASSGLLSCWRRARVGDDALNLRWWLGADQQGARLGRADRAPGHTVVPPAGGVATLSSSYAARS
jgi:hypothetical protein